MPGTAACPPMVFQPCGSMHSMAIHAWLEEQPMVDSHLGEWVRKEPNRVRD